MNKIEALIKEALELIELYSGNDKHTKFSQNHVDRVANLYEELDNALTKRYIKKNISDSINIINILKQIIQILKNRDLEIDKKSLKSLKAKESYILKMQGKNASSPFEIYHNAKNKIISIIDKGLKDNDSMLKISMLLEEMKSAYEEDNDTGGSGKLHIAECHKDFNEIQAYLDETPQMAQKRRSIDSIAEHAQTILDNYSQNDSELTKQLAEEGSEERKAQDSIIDKAKHVNSSAKVDLSILFFEYVGYGGMIASFILGTYFIAYDIEYHLPKFYTSLGVTGVYIFSVLLMILIMGMIHIPLHSTVNNKWLKGSKKLLYFLLVLGIPLKVFLDYRANVNYSNKVATANMVKDLNSSNSILGLKNQQAKADIDARKTELKSFRDDLKAQKKLLQPYYKEQTRLENKIAMYDAKKRLTRNQKRDKKLAISKLEIAESNINRINREIKNIQNKIDKTNGYVKDSQNSLISVIRTANEEKENDALIRKIFLIALTFIIELASLGGVFAGVLINKNSKVDLESLHKYKQSLDTRTLVNSFLDRQTALNNEAYGAELEVRRHIARIGNARRLSDTIQHSQDIEMVAEVIDNVKQANSKLVGLAFRNGVLPNAK